MLSLRTNRPRPKTYLRADALEARVTPAAFPAGFFEAAAIAGLSRATSLAVAPDGRMFITEQTGAVRVIQNGVLQTMPFLQLTVDSTGERGLLGLEFDPNFATNGFVYIYHTVPAAGGNAPFNRISRVQASGNVAVPNSLTPLVNLDPLAVQTNHNGGAMHFGPDGKLYVAVGENANPANSQNLNNRLGKILRYNADGSIPTDNPTTFDGFPGQTTTGANQAIWAVGLRNPFTFAFQPGTGVMFINDVGGSLFEEVNLGRAGANFGWGLTEGDFNQASFPNFTRPLFAYPHDNSTFGGSSVTGGAFYNPTTTNFPPQLVGDYFFADFISRRLFVRDAATGNVSLFGTDLSGGTVDLDVLPNGDLVYLSLGFGQGQGTVHIIRHDGTTPLPALPTIPGTSNGMLPGSNPPPGGGNPQPPGPTPPGSPPVLLPPSASGSPRLAAATAGLVSVIDAQTGASLAQFAPYGAGYVGEVRVAMADLNGDGVAEFITGVGAGGPPHVKVFDGQTLQELYSFFAYDPAFVGGVFVAGGDVNGDSVADVIVGTATGSSHIKVYDGATGAEVRSFFAFDRAYLGGITVAAGDLDGDGRAEIIAGTSPGGPPHVVAFDGATGALVQSFFAFDTAFLGGLTLASDDVDGDGLADILVTTRTGPPHVRALRGSDLAELSSFFAYDPAFQGGVRLSATDVNGDGRAEVITGPGPGAPADMRVIDALTGQPLSAFLAFDPSFLGGVFVGAG
jgi:glucose/arabinose dehydrogenase